MHAPLLAFLAHYHPLPAADQERIAAIATPRQYREGDTLFAQGHICRQLFFIKSGVVRITVTREDGQVAIPFFVRENKLCTILHSFLQQTLAHESIEAACDLEVYVFQRDALYALYQDIPYLQGLIQQITQQSLLDKIALRNAFMGLDAAARYRFFLEQMPDVATRVSMGDIAAYLDITPQSLSRIRKQLR